MITGDGNLIDVKAIVRYRVVDARVFLFEVNNPAELLRANTESILRSTIAGRRFFSLLTAERAQVQWEVFVLLKARCRQLNKDDLGIRIEGLSLVDMHPPAEVVNDYYDVAKAMENRDQKKYDAEKEALAKVHTAESESTRILTQAASLRAEKVGAATADAQRFLALSQARKAHPGLTDFRIFWEVVGQSLMGRDLILVDSDKVAGQRNLWLIDPDMLRAPAPMIAPQERKRTQDEEP